MGSGRLVWHLSQRRPDTSLHCCPAMLFSLSPKKEPRICGALEFSSRNQIDAAASSAACRGYRMDCSALACKDLQSRTFHCKDCSFLGCRNYPAWWGSHCYGGEAGRRYRQSDSAPSPNGSEPKLQKRQPERSLRPQSVGSFSYFPLNADAPNQFKFCFRSSMYAKRESPRVLCHRSWVRPCLSCDLSGIDQAQLLRPPLLGDLRSRIDDQWNQ